MPAAEKRLLNDPAWAIAEKDNAEVTVGSKMGRRLLMAQ